MRCLWGLIVISMLVAFVTAHAWQDTHTYVYGLIIDAGSSGSRIYTYTWLQRNDNSLPDLDTAPLNQTQWSLKTSPGLATFANNLAGIPGYLAPLIQYAQKNLDPAVLPTTVLYLKATGGLRALSLTDQANIIQATRQYLHTTPFNFTDSWASVIQLDQEALYGWITVNYVTKSLVDPLSTKGGMDMGGATTEISFIPADQTPLLHDSVTSLAGHTYNVYTGGYAARGLDSALALVLSQLASTATSSTILNPCYLTGYSEPLSVTAPDGTVTTYTVWGTSDSAACRTLSSLVLLNTSVPCNVSPCAFNGLYQPPLRGNFYAYSGFFYTYSVFFPQSNAISLTDFATASNSFCALNITQAQALYPSQAVSFLKNYCFTSSYMIGLFGVYGFAPDATSITFAGTVNGYEVSYAMGAMLYEANLLPFVITTPTTSGGVVSTVWSLYLVVASVLGLLVVM